MRTGDGLLVRLRLSGRPLGPDRAEAIADCAARFGNGVIEISSRANLQLRGVREAGLADLQRRLRELRLLDADAAAEAVRNIVASPIADIDPLAIVDAAPIVAALEARLGADSSLHRLPAKFGFLIDGGGALPLGDVEADLRFEAFAGSEGVRFAVRLNGEPHPQPLPVRTGRGVRGAGFLPSPPLAGRGRGWGAPRSVRSSPPTTSPTSPRVSPARS